MIKRILVALDSDSDTVIATRYAIEMAKKTDSRITGLAVVDTGSIESSSRGGGIGSMYYGEKLRERLTQETRDKARELIKIFESEAEKAGVDHIETVEEGVPFERIVEDMKVHDILLLGSDPHFFYGHPKQHTDTLERVFHRTIGPTLVVTGPYRPIKKVVLATDGDNASSKALRRYLQIRPFGDDVEMDVVMVIADDAYSSDASLHLEMVKSYVEHHGISVRCTSMIDKNPAQCILDHVDSVGADLILAGVHTKESMRRVSIGKNTRAFLSESKVPVFLDH